ncbi:MAG: aldo/keto reductase [Armatimonadetes bacterium]|nr:aldo/keto reductase [Armatimonadota bacterium]
MDGRQSTERPGQQRESAAVTRRDFLRRSVVGLAAAGLASAGLAAPPRGGGGKQGFTAAVANDAGTGMPYIGIPACQIRVSRIIMGPAAEAVQSRMIQYGANYFHKVDACGSKQFMSKLDWDYFFCDVVIDKVERDQVLQEFERRRSRVGLDVVHFFKIHGTLKKPEDLESHDGLFEAFERLRDQGKTRWLAISLHAGAEMLDACVESGRFQQIQIMFNPANASQELRAAIAKAQQRGIAITAMKTMMGGPRKWQNNARAKQALQQYWPQGASPAQAVVRWVLAQPGITMVVPRCANTQQADENCTAAGAQLQAWEEEGVQALAAALSDTYCRSCRTCEAHCPEGLPVADLLRYRMYAADYGDTDGARRLYASLPASARADRCTDCGLCEETCPHGVAVRELMAEARRVLA